MGFDLIGVKPENIKGEYFRNNVWYWRPLWSYVAEKLSLLTHEEHVQGYLNNGYRIDNEKAKAIANKLTELIGTGEFQRDIEEYSKRIAALPDLPCSCCGGRGVTHSNDGDDSRACLSCQGTGKIRDPRKNYPADIDNVKDFAEFCQHSGGFEIW